jgi:hypothetical protein
LIDVLWNLERFTKDLTTFTEYAPWLLVLYFVNCFLVFLSSDFSLYISSLYKLKIGFETVALNGKAKALNSLESEFKGRILEFDRQVVDEKFREIDFRLREKLQLASEVLLLSDDVLREKMRGQCSLPLAIRKNHRLKHNYTIEKSESMVNFSVDSVKKIYFQTYIKIKKSFDVNLFGFELHLFNGIRNGGRYLIAPIYQQIIVEDINSLGGRSVSAELTCFVPFVFFPSIYINEVLFCLKYEDKYYPIAYGTLEPK